MAPIPWYFYRPGGPIVPAAGIVFPVWASVTGEVIPSDWQFLVLAGRNTPGDCDGLLLLSRQNSQPTYPGSYLQTADGAYWLLLPDERGVCGNAFNAIPDGAVGVNRAFSGTDNATALQQAWDYATYGCKCAMYLLSGDYRTTKVMLGGWGTSFTTPILKGVGPKNKGESAYSGVAILCDYSDQCGFVLQGVRNALIEDISFIGTNFNWCESQGLGGLSPTRADTSVSDWVASGLATNANSRYAPYAGGALDAYSGPQPAVGDRYPDLTPPAWLAGWTGQYNKLTSSGYTLRRVQFVGFVAGFVNQPANIDENGDFPTFDKCAIRFCAYGVSIGNSQCRDLNIRDLDLSGVHTWLAANAHGAQAGKLQGLVAGSQGADCIQWVDTTDAATAGPLTFQNCYGEAVFKIGRWQSGGSAAKQLVFDNCVINFTGQTEGTTYARGRPTLALDATSPNPITFRAGFYTNYLGLLMFGGAASDYRFEDGVEFIPASTPSTPVQRVFRNFLAGVGFEILQTAPAPETFSVTVARYSQSAAQTTETVGQAVPLQRSHPVCAWSRYARPINAPSYILPVPRLWQPKTKSTLSSLSRVGLEVTIVFTALPDDVAAQTGWLPGCAVWDDNSKVWMRIHSRVTTTVIATIITGYVNDGTTITLNNPFSTTAGNLYSGSALAFLPSDYLQGDISSASATIANVGKATGDGTWLSGEIAAGDYFYADTAISNWISSSKSLIDTVTNGSPGSITLTAGNFPNQTATNFHLGWLLQAAPANE